MNKHQIYDAPFDLNKSKIKQKLRVAVGQVNNIKHDEVEIPFFWK